MGKSVLRRIARSLAAIGSLALVIVPAATASGHDESDEHEAHIAPGSRYVAMGSSFAAGPGIDPIVDVGCGRSANNYPQLIAAKLDLNLTDVTCSGATINHIVDTSQVAGGVSRLPQVFAVGPDTDLVTITIGGNDFNYLLNMFRYSCQADPAPVDAIPGINAVVKGILCAPVDVAATQTLLNGVEAEMNAMVDAIQTRAPDAKIVLVDYMTIFPERGTCGETPMSLAQIAYMNDLAAQLASATKRVAKRYGVELVKLSKVSRSHHICSKRPWVGGWEFGNLFGGGVVAYHLNAAGMAATARLVLDELDRGDD